MIRCLKITKHKPIGTMTVTQAIFTNISNSSNSNKAFSQIASFENALLLFNDKMTEEAILQYVCSDHYDKNWMKHKEVSFIFEAPTAPA